MCTHFLQFYCVANAFNISAGNEKNESFCWRLLFILRICSQLQPQHPDLLRNAVLFIRKFIMRFRSKENKFASQHSMHTCIHSSTKLPLLVIRSLIISASNFFLRFSSLLFNSLAFWLRFRCFLSLHTFHLIQYTLAYYIVISFHTECCFILLCGDSWNDFSVNALLVHVVCAVRFLISNFSIWYHFAHLMREANYDAFRPKLLVLAIAVVDVDPTASHTFHLLFAAVTDSEWKMNGEKNAHRNDWNLMNSMISDYSANARRACTQSITREMATKNIHTPPMIGCDGLCSHADIVLTLSPSFARYPLLSI